MIGKLLLATSLLLSFNANEASMNGQMVNGKILDPRITACGIRIDGDDNLFLRPFIETSDELAGTFRLAITNRSGSNASVTSQTNRFSGGSLGSSVVGIGQAAQVSVSLEVNEVSGTALCRVKTDLNFDKNSTRL